MSWLVMSVGDVVVRDVQVRDIEVGELALVMSLFVISRFANPDCDVLVGNVLGLDRGVGDVEVRDVLGRIACGVGDQRRIGVRIQTIWVSPRSVLSVTLTVTLNLSDPVEAFTHTVRAVNDRGGTLTVTCSVEGTPAGSVKPAVTPDGATMVRLKER